MSFDKDLNGLLAYYINDHPADLLKSLDEISTILTLATLNKPEEADSAITDLNNFRSNVVSAIFEQSVDENMNVRELATNILNSKLQVGTAEIVHRIREDYNQELYLKSDSLWQDAKEH